MTITAAITFVDSDTGRNYQVRLVKEGATTDDYSKRFIAKPVEWRDGRLAFMFSDVEGDPHGEARHVGNLFNLRHETIDGDSWVVSDLDWDTDELAIEAKRLVDEERITGVSIQPTDGEVFLVCGSPPDGSTIDDLRRLAEQFSPETCGEDDWIEAWGDLIIGSATLLTTPAFEDAKVVTADGMPLFVPIEAPPNIFQGNTITDNKVTITDNTVNTGYGIQIGPRLPDDKDDTERVQRAINAAADLKRPPAEWFEDPQLDGPTPLTITDEGRVFGHLALWDTCHRGFESSCITPPRESTEYAEFHDNARVMLDNGKLVGVGCLTVDVSHADGLAPSEVAKRHYDHSGTTAAFTKAGSDQYGVWLAGAVAPWATDDSIEKLRRLSLSGDWRPKNGSYFLIAAQAVPVPGFPIRARVASGIQVELTTVGPANIPPDPLEEASDLALVAAALGELVTTVAYIKDRLEREDRQKEYEKALEILAEGANV